MEFICYSSWEQLPGSAEALFAHSAKESLFASRQWLEAVSDVVCTGDQSLALAGVLSENRLVALLPLIKSPGNNWGALRHRYSPHYNLLVVSENRTQIIACLAQGLIELPINGMLLEPVINMNNAIDDLQRQLEDSGVSCERHFRHYNWIYRVQEQNYQQFLSKRPARLRNTLLRKKRKLEREHGYQIRLYTGEDAIQAMQDYYAVYDASWKANEQFPDFVDKVVANFSRVGWIRLAVLYTQGRPVAAQLWFVHSGKASIFRLCYDEQWKPYSTGSILTSFLMEHVIEIDKVEEIDFLTGNEAYKQDWMSERNECCALSCISNVPFEGNPKLLSKVLNRLFK